MVILLRYLVKEAAPASQYTRLSALCSGGSVTSEPSASPSPSSGATYMVWPPQMGCSGTPRYSTASRRGCW